jgi:hypothetical protein
MNILRVKQSDQVMQPAQPIWREHGKLDYLVCSPRFCGFNHIDNLTTHLSNLQTDSQFTVISRGIAALQAAHGILSDLLAPL